jgi:hypothetical protein
MICVHHIPPDKSLQTLELLETQFVVHGCRGFIAVLRAHPELALVGTRERGWIFLRLVLEDPEALARQLMRAHGHGHLDALGFPLLPRTAVQPNHTFGDPLDALNEISQIAGERILIGV